MGCCERIQGGGSTGGEEQRSCEKKANSSSQMRQEAQHTEVMREGWGNSITASFYWCNPRAH